MQKPYRIELIGAFHYGVDDSDWACEEDFIPDERTCTALNINDDCDWEDVLTTIVDILKELVIELDELPLLAVSHITTGFCDGDLYVVK